MNMGRKIKFRAYNKETGEMMLWYDIQRFGNLNKLITLNHVVLQQFTGLYDKHGIEIYHGDIVKAKAKDVIHPQDLHKIKEEYVTSSIYWYQSECCFETHFNCFSFSDSEKILEVIGNIYNI